MTPQAGLGPDRWPPSRVGTASRPGSEANDRGVSASGPGSGANDRGVSARQAGTRERIVAAAVTLFAEQGFDATSVNQVVARAGVAKGALYHHFASKDDLLYEVYRELVDRQAAGLTEILNRGLPPAQALRELIADLVATTAARVREAKVFFRESHRLGDANQARVRSARRGIHDAVTDLVRSAQASGEFTRVASPEMITFTIFGVINELPVWYRPDGPKQPPEIAAELSSLILAALCRDLPSQLKQ